MIHAVLVLPVLALNILTALQGNHARNALGLFADFCGLLMWLPINALIEIDRTDVFFLLIPFNSIVYGLLFAAPLHALALHRARKPESFSQS